MGELHVRIGELDWRVDAACRGVDTAAFYHPDNERGTARARRESRAKAVCAVCPVSEQCLRWALATRERYGVWGGLTVEERATLLAGPSAIRGPGSSRTGTSSGRAG